MLPGALSALSAGMETVIPTPALFRNRDVIANYWRLVEKHRATTLSAVPTVLAALANVPLAGADISSIRYCRTGAAPLAPELAARFERMFGLHRARGARHDRDEPASRPSRRRESHGPAGCVGFRLPYSQLRIVALDAHGNATDRDVPAGETGMVLFKSPNVFSGFVDAEDNAKAFTADGWLATGDLGWLDAEGRLNLTGRSKDLIIRSGHNIDPKVIEDALGAHPAVQLCAAVGAPDAYAGELPVAFATLIPGASVSEAELLEFAAQRVDEAPARPKSVTIIDKMPMTNVGKIYKPELRAAGRQGSGRGAGRRSLPRARRGRTAPHRSRRQRRHRAARRRHPGSRRAITATGARTPAVQDHADAPLSCGDITMNRSRWLVRTGIVLAAVVAVLAAAGWAVLSQPQFGARMSGARLERAKANPQYRDGRFVNLQPETPTSLASLGGYIVRQFSGDEVREPPAPLPVMAVDKAALAAAPAPIGLRAFWIGHASTYVELDGLRLLLDPVFAERVSPLPVGPQRFHPPPIALADLPPIDAVLISHDHYAREALVPGALVDLQPGVPRLGRADPPHRRRSTPDGRRAGDAAAGGVGGCGPRVSVDAVVGGCALKRATSLSEAAAPPFAADP